MPRRSVAPFCRGERLQTRPGTIPLPAAYLTLRRFEASDRESHKTPRWGRVMSKRFNLPHPRCVGALALKGGGQEGVGAACKLHRVDSPSAARAPFKQAG